MRCRCCNKRLELSEVSKKDTNGKYLETCVECISTIQEAIDEFNPEKISYNAIDKD